MESLNRPKMELPSQTPQKRKNNSILIKLHKVGLQSHANFGFIAFWFSNGVINLMYSMHLKIAENTMC